MMSIYTIVDASQKPRKNAEYQKTPITQIFIGSLMEKWLRSINPEFSENLQPWLDNILNQYEKRVLPLSGSERASCRKLVFL